MTALPCLHNPTPSPPDSGAGAPLVTRLVNGFHALPLGLWDDLWQRDPAAHPYNSLPWIAAWEKHFAPEGVQVILIETAGHLVAALPVYICARWGEGRIRGRLLTMAGSCSSAYPLDMAPLVDPAYRDRALTEIADALLHIGGAEGILFELFAAGSVTDALLAEVERISGRAAERHAVEDSHITQLAPTYDAFLESLGSRTRRNVRAYAKKFFEAGPQHAVRAASTASEFTALMDAMADQKARRFATLGKKSNFDETRLTNFLNDALPALHARGLLTGLQAEVDGKIAATQLYLHDPHGHAYSYNSSFDPDFKELRLHYILETERFKRAIEAGYAAMDLSTGHAEHKEHWTGGNKRALYEGVLFINTTGRMLNGALDFLRRIKRSATSGSEA